MVQCCQCQIKYDPVNKCTKETSGKIKLHILGAWQNAHEM